MLRGGCGGCGGSVTSECAEPQSSGDRSGQGGMVEEKDRLKLGRVLPTKWERKHSSQIAFSVIK